MQQMSHSNFSRPEGNSGAAGGFQRMGGTSESAAHGWNRFGEPIHGTAGAGEASQFNRGYSPSAANREGGAVRISPPIVQQRDAQPRGYSSGYSSQGSSQPRSFGGARVAPSGGGGSSHASGGGHSSGGGGHHR
jgi:hypothetical protein